MNKKIFNIERDYREDVIKRVVDYLEKVLSEDYINDERYIILEITDNE